MRPADIFSYEFNLHSFCNNNDNNFAELHQIRTGLILVWGSAYMRTFLYMFCNALTPFFLFQSELFPSEVLSPVTLSVCVSLLPRWWWISTAPRPQRARSPWVKPSSSVWPRTSGRTYRRYCRMVRCCVYRCQCTQLQAKPSKRLQKNVR